MVTGKKGMEIMPCFYLPACILVLCGVLLNFRLFSAVEVVINDAGFVYTVESRASSVGDLLAEQEIEVAFHDKLYPGIYAPLDDGTEVIIERTIPVMISREDSVTTYYTTADTVKKFLEEMKVPFDDSFFVTPLPESLLTPGMKITLVPRRVVTEYIQEKIPYDTRKNEIKELPKGKHVIIQQGREGIREFEYRVVYAGDKEFSRELIQDRIIKNPIDAVVNIGTGVETVPQRQTVAASRGERINDYTNEGYASWYGSKFHGRRTSSGEIYNQYGFTGAHRQLPFGTLVKVTFLRTGKSVEVTINDRGPLKHERIIDLSGAAAEAIGLKPFGVGWVRIEVVN